MKSSHRLFDRFVIRTPVLPLDALVALADPDPNVVRTRLRALLGDPNVGEAMFVASPELADALDAWRRGTDPDPALERTLVRYVSRMAGRATPFGLFSGVAVGRVGAATELALAARTEHRRHTRLDNDYLAKLCDALAGDPVVPNSSLYLAGDRWRFARGIVSDAGRSYQLTSVDASPYLDAAIARANHGATRAQLGDAIAAVDAELPRDEIDAFVAEACSAQVFVSSIQPNVTGDEPSATLIRAFAGTPVAAALSSAALALSAIDETRAATPDAYRAIAATLAEQPVPVNLARLFQTDVHLAMPSATLGPRVALELARGFETLRRLAATSPATDWTRFREAFGARYETREVPLVEVLDEESGIGFGAAPSDTAQAPLLADLAFPPRDGIGQTSWGGSHARQLVLLANALSRGATEIVLADEDLDAIAPAVPGRIADTLSVSAMIVATSRDAIDRGDFTLRMSGFGSASATRMYGRFCHGNDEMVALVRDLCAHEQRAAPDAIFAEIVHLPEGRIGNILLRPVLRDYEIPYLGASGAPRDRQLPVTDLRVSIDGERVVLRSASLGREVRPQLATAHNYSARSLAIYRFLCAHSSQSTTGGGWSWGALDDSPYLPRVRRDRVVLSRARWVLRRADLEPLKAAKTLDAAVGAGRALRDRCKMPRWIVVADGDNELPVDFDNPLSVESFVHLVKGRAYVILFEMFPAPGELVVAGPEGAHAHELVVAFVRDPIAPERAAAPPPATVARRFPPGSEWLYAKLYAGTATSDRLLGELVAPFVREVLAEKSADRMFFLRYADPDDHVRIRFHGDPATLAGVVLPKLAAAFADPIARGFVWRMQLDTYEREVERYGGDAGIELAEAIFAADSEAALAIVEATPGDDGARARWQLVVRGIDRLLVDLGMSLAERHALMIGMRDSFGAEHGMDAAFQRQLGDRYRARQGAIAGILTARDDDDGHDLAPGIAAIAHRSVALAPIAEKLRAIRDVRELAGSLVHMHVNRMLPNAQRRQELVLYDHLRRYYESVIARGARKP